MNVILVNDHVSLTGGVARVAISEAVGLAAQGHTVVFFGASGEPCPELIDAGVHIEHLHQPEILQDPSPVRAAWRGIRNSTACERLRLALSRFDPAETIVHFHSWMKALSPAILRVPRQEGYRSILTLHDFFTACPNGGFIVHPTASICHRKPLGASCLTCNCDSRSPVHKVWRVARQAAQNALWKAPSHIDAYISVSGFCAKILQPHLDPSIPVTVVHNPVAVTRKPLAERGGGYFVFAGRLSREKGAIVFAKAAREAGVATKFVGEGEEARRVLKECPQAELTGWRPHHEVLGQIRSATALIFPSIWYETQGLTVLEAMANGVPVIVSDCTAAAEYVQHGQTGLHFPAGDSSALARAIQQLQDKAEAQRLATNAYNWFWDNPWSLEKHLKQLLRVYRGALPQRRAAPA